MELYPDIACQTGNAVSMGRIIRSACILNKSCKKKKLTSSNIQYAIYIHFSGEKRKVSITTATKKLFTFIADQESNQPSNYQEINKKIKEACQKHGVNKISQYAIIYLNAIFKDIDNWDVDELFVYEEETSIENFLNTCFYVMENDKKKTLSQEHFQTAKEISMPQETKITWTFDKNVKVIKENYPGKLSRSALDLIHTL